jgi:hypothetical protein
MAGLVMRITVSMPSTGIFYAPGLAQPVVIDTSTLPAAVAAKLERLADAARLFEQAEAAPTGPGKHRDAQEFVITVEAEGKERTLHFADPIESIANAPLREFVELVREEAQRERQKDKPG